MRSNSQPEQRLASIGQFMTRRSSAPSMTSNGSSESSAADGRENPSDTDHYVRSNSQPEQRSASVTQFVTGRSSAPSIASGRSRESTEALSTASTRSPVRPSGTTRVSKSDSGRRRSKSTSRYSRQSSLPESSTATKHPAKPISKSKSAGSFDVLHREMAMEDSVVKDESVCRTDFRRSISGTGPKIPRENSVSDQRTSNLQELVPIPNSKARQGSPGSRDSSHSVSSIPLQQLIPIHNTKPASSVVSSTHVLQQLIPIPKVATASSLDVLKGTTPKNLDDDSAAAISGENKSNEAEINPFVRSSEGLTLSYQHSMSDICGMTSSPGSDSSSSSPQAVITDLGPVKVNLNARHFCGKRRDRMRPMKRRGSSFL